MVSPAPTPCTARPQINAAMVVAVPATSSPTTKSSQPAASGLTGPRRSAQIPAVTIPTIPPAAGMAKANAYWVSPCRAAATVGMAVDTATASNAWTATIVTLAPVSARSPGEKGPGAGVVVPAGC